MLPGARRLHSPGNRLGGERPFGSHMGRSKQRCVRGRSMAAPPALQQHLLQQREKRRPVCGTIHERIAKRGSHQSLCMAAACPIPPARREPQVAGAARGLQNRRGAAYRPRWVRFPQAPATSSGGFLPPRQENPHGHRHRQGRGRNTTVTGAERTMNSGNAARDICRWDRVVIRAGGSPVRRYRVSVVETDEEAFEFAFNGEAIVFPRYITRETLVHLISALPPEPQQSAPAGPDQGPVHGPSSPV